MAKFVLGGESFDLEKEDVLRAMKDVPPGPIRKYAVMINREKHSIKQVVSYAVTAALRKKFTVAQFTAHDAYRVLKKLGFSILVEKL